MLGWHLKPAYYHARAYENIHGAVGLSVVGKKGKICMFSHGGPHAWDGSTAMNEAEGVAVVIVH